MLSQEHMKDARLSHNIFKCVTKYGKFEFEAACQQPGWQHPSALKQQLVSGLELIHQLLQII